MLSIIVPAYNEEQMVPLAEQTISQLMQQENIPYEPVMPVAAGTLLSIFISPMSATGVEDEKSSCNSIFAVSFVIKA